MKRKMWTLRKRSTGEIVGDFTTDKPRAWKGQEAVEVYVTLADPPDEPIKEVFEGVYVEIVDGKMVREFDGTPLLYDETYRDEEGDYREVKVTVEEVRE